jgi:endo-1,4-beta-xylanase
MLTRRQFLAGTAAIAACTSSKLGAIPEASMTLRELAAKRGILYGSSLGTAGLKDQPFAALFAQQCGIAVPEHALTWVALRPTPETYDFSGSDSIEQFARSHNMLIRGVPLAWEAARPKWFAPTVNLDNAKRVLLSHISTVVGHYAGRMHSWDVVNEGTQIDDGRPDGLKVTPWLLYIGPEYIDLAFHAAHQADPKAMLVYNENRLETESSAAEEKRRAVLALLTRLVRRGVPIHGLGVQSHFNSETVVPGPNFKRFLHAVEDLGLTILVTELDVRDHFLPGDISVRDALVAKQYYNYLSFILQFKSVKTVLTWGLSDRSTWLSYNDPRKDGLPVRPLLFDADLQPKPAFDAVMRAFNEAPKR